jgi:hypothetical protein
MVEPCAFRGELVVDVQRLELLVERPFRRPVGDDHGAEPVAAVGRPVLDREGSGPS